MTKTCHQCSQQFEITDDDLKFYEKASPVFNGKKYIIPAPTFCPDCRQQRRLCFRNERNLYKRKCDATGKEIISIYSPDKSYKVYDQEEWWSDRWDPLSYGKEYDFYKSYFEQFNELQLVVPKFNLNNSRSENSDYCNDARFNKNSYLIFASDYCTDCLYLWNVRKGLDIVDCNNVDNATLSYECMDSDTLYQCVFCLNCFRCNECKFCFDCTDCNYCFLCTNLNKKEYYISNKPYSKEDYFKTIDKINLKSYKVFQDILNKFKKLSSTRIVKNLNMINSENSVGDALIQCNNCNNSFYVDDSNDVKYCCFSAQLKTSYDQDICGWTGELLYEDIGTWGTDYHILFSSNCRESSDLMYCDLCFQSKDLWGCIGLKKKQYCILNKQYTKEEYEALVPKIIEHMMNPNHSTSASGSWGEFFPHSISPFGYNETMAQEYFPLTKEEVLARGWKWHEDEVKADLVPDGVNILKGDQVTDDISKVDESILKKILLCEVTNKPYKIIPQELAFYLKQGIPLPRRHPDQRHLDRLHLRNPRKLWDRNCMKCGKEIKTTYSPERKEIVYCDRCYQEEVY